MKFTSFDFKSPKLGFDIEECEDALSYDNEKALYVIADGVTDSAFQKIWANLLVDEFINDPPISLSPPSIGMWFSDWLKRIQEKWGKSIEWDNIPWHGENKAKLIGGLSTFLAVRFKAQQGIWESISIGDCNLFHFQNDELIESWPIKDASMFSCRTKALSSIDMNYQKQQEIISYNRGRFTENDVFFLATDALSEYLLKISLDEMKFKSVINQLSSLSSICDFESYIYEIKNKNLIKDDDISILIINLTDE